MLSAKPCVAIAPQQKDELDPSFDFIHAAHRDFATEMVREVNRSQVEKLQCELNQGRQLLEAKERMTRRGEFSGFKNSLNLTTTDVRKCMSFAATFGDWAIEKIVVIASATNIFSLCQKKYAEVVEHLHSASVVTREFVQRLLKEFRGKAAAERKKSKEKANVPKNDGDVLQQHIDGDSGTYYTLSEANLSEKVGSALAEQLKERSLGQILAQALEPSPDRQEVERLQRQIVDAVSEMRGVQIEMRRQLIQRDHRIEELEALLSKVATASSDKPESAMEVNQKEASHQRSSAVSQLIWAKQEQLIVEFLEHSCGDIFTVWLPGISEPEMVTATGLASFLQTIDNF